MFFYKDNQGNLHELNDENIVARCPMCHKETTVDLATMGTEWGWYDTNLFCSEFCYEWYKADREIADDDERPILRLVRNEEYPPHTHRNTFHVDSSPSIFIGPCTWIIIQVA